MFEVQGAQPHFFGIRIESPRENPQEKIPLNAVEREPVPTRVLNPNASEASYKPKQRNYRKTKLIFFSFFRGDFARGGSIREPIFLHSAYSLGS